MDDRPQIHNNVGCGSLSTTKSVSNLNSLHQMQEIYSPWRTQDHKTWTFFVYERHQRNNLGIFGKMSVWASLRSLCAQLSSVDPEQVIVFVLANTTTSKKNRTTTIDHS